VGIGILVAVQVEVAGTNRLLLDNTELADQEALLEQMVWPAVSTISGVAAVVGEQLAGMEDITEPIMVAVVQVARQLTLTAIQ
jgi:saccharopine dehydrogenase-like NADP-dependent oxidoreductase